MSQFYRLAAGGSREQPSTLSLEPTASDESGFAANRECDQNGGPEHRLSAIGYRSFASELQAS